MSAGEVPERGNARAIEARLLAGAVIITSFAAAMLGWTESNELPPTVLITGVTLAVTAIVLHVTVRATAPDADPTILPVVFLLNGLGLVFVRRIDLATGSDLAAAQTVWTIVSAGAFCGLLLFIRHIRVLARYPYTFALLTLLLLAAPLLPGISAGVINGAQLWVEVAGMRFQPGEIAKLTMVIFLAAYLERNRALLSVATQRIGPVLLPALRHLAPVLLAAVLALAVMVYLRDLGTALLFFGAFVGMLYVATGRAAYPVLGAMTFALAAYGAILTFSHVRTRVDIWLDPWADVTGNGYQIAQSLFALGTGGLTGTGIGFGRPQDVPFSATDAIFAVIGEELGLLGATAILLLFFLVVVRGLRIALTARDEFSTLLALGLTLILATQTFVIIGGLTRLMPLTGITLPFVAYGGSALLSNYLLVAMLLRVSDESRGSARGRTPTAPRRTWPGVRAPAARPQAGARP